MKLPEVSITNIMYATDLSENARYAFAYAVSLAERYGARITILHVIQEMPDLLERNVLGHVAREKWEEIKARNIQETRSSLIGKRRDNILIREVLTQFTKDVKRDSAGETEFSDEIVIDRGNPAKQILKQTELRQCDMIVMGSHGETSLADVMMGSITRRVLRKSGKPVLVVRLPGTD